MRTMGAPTLLYSWVDMPGEQREKVGENQAACVMTKWRRTRRGATRSKHPGEHSKKAGASAVKEVRPRFWEQVGKRLFGNRTESSDCVRPDIQAKSDGICQQSPSEG